MNSIPRRVRIELLTPEELAIFNMVGEVEKLGAHPILTNVVVLLVEARGQLADWVDLQAAQRGEQADGADPKNDNEFQEALARLFREKPSPNRRRLFQ